MSEGIGLRPARLRSSDVARVATVGLRTRPLRAALSALGVAVGVAAMGAVLGLSASSQAGLLSEIDRLGTNLLTVTQVQKLFGKTAAHSHRRRAPPRSRSPPPPPATRSYPQDRPAACVCWRRASTCPL